MSVGDAVAGLLDAERLLIGLDYDGTIAPIVDDPRDAVPHDATIAALMAIAQVPSVTCAVISGRARSVLAELSGLGPPVLLIGCHGADGGDERSLPGRTELVPLRKCAEMLAGRYPGVVVEYKPTGVALHYRQVPLHHQVEVRADIEQELQNLGPAVASVLHGQLVVEAAVVPLDKGAALEGLRRMTGADRVMFIGDDLTDELAFSRLGPDDVGIKVGSDPTVAAHRVDDVTAVGEVLERLSAGLTELSAARR